MNATRCSHPNSYITRNQATVGSSKADEMYLNIYIVDTDIDIDGVASGSAIYDSIPLNTAKKSTWMRAHCSHSLATGIAYVCTTTQLGFSSAFLSNIHANTKSRGCWNSKHKTTTETLSLSLSLLQPYTTWSHTGKNKKYQRTLSSPARLPIAQSSIPGTDPLQPF